MANKTTLFYQNSIEMPERLQADLNKIWREILFSAIFYYINNTDGFEVTNKS